MREWHPSQGQGQGNQAQASMSDDDGSGHNTQQPPENVFCLLILLLCYSQATLAEWVMTDVQKEHFWNFNQSLQYICLIALWSILLISAVLIQSLLSHFFLTTNISDRRCRIFLTWWISHDIEDVERWPAGKLSKSNSAPTIKAARLPACLGYFGIMCIVGQI